MRVDTLGRAGGDEYAWAGELAYDDILPCIAFERFGDTYWGIVPCRSEHSERHGDDSK